MSSQRGNVSRNRPQKHKNRHAFKNDLHDKSNKIKMINSIQVGDVCARCKDIIDWKIKYKKYKPLSQPKSCTKCAQKTIKKAYHVICTECVKKFKVCAKCLESKEIIPAAPDQQEQLKLDAEMRAMLQSLPERKRRTFIRYMNKKQEATSENPQPKEEQKDDLMEKLNKLKLEAGCDDDDDFGSDFGSDVDDIDEDDDCNSDGDDKI